MIKTINLQKDYGDLKVLKGISTDIKQGEIVAVIGPSGSGKSTFLRCLNLMEQPTGGEVFFKGKSLTEKMLKEAEIDQIRQHIGMVFQHFNLFPNMTVLENIILAPMKLKNLSKAEATTIAEALLRKVGLSDKKDVYPNKLSGGQKQRVAIARCFASQSAIFLMDEPFSALDAFTREKAQQLFLNCWQASQPLTVFVTHDIEEAVLLADEVIVMAANPGQIKKRIPSPFSNKLDLIKNRQSLQLFETVQALRKEIEA